MKIFKTKNNGFTLIETMIYIALFSVIIGSALIAVYGIIQNTDKTQAKIIFEGEASFVLQKINYAITGTNMILLPLLGENGIALTLSKSTGNISLQLSGDKLQIKDGGMVFLDINNDDVRISNVVFKHIAGVSGGVESIDTAFMITDNYGHSQTFHETTYLRK